jgi:hypothetical protein
MPLDRFVYRLEYIQNEMGQAAVINISEVMAGIAQGLNILPID